MRSIHHNPTSNNNKHIKWKFVQHSCSKTEYKYRRKGKPDVTVFIDLVTYKWYFLLEKGVSSPLRCNSNSDRHLGKLFATIEIELNNFLTHRRFE